MCQKLTRGRDVALEALELRRFLSTVHVVNFGAAPNDGGDDSAAIQRAINGSGHGDTIVFAPGTYHVGDTVRLAGNRKYRGNDATLKGRRETHMFVINTDNVRIDGFTFDGKPIHIDKADLSMNQNIVINNNTFHIHADGEGENGINFTTGLRNSRITNNSFATIDGDNGVYGYYWDDLVIANNEFLNGNEGIHVIDHSDRSRDLLIEQNYFANLRRMAIEYQGGGHDTVVQDNYYEKPWLTGVWEQNMSTFAYSLIADRSVGTIARRNTVIAPERPDGTGVRIGFEMGGDDARVEDNYSEGTEAVVSANDFHGTTSVLVRNNRFRGYLKGPDGRNVTKHNNGHDTELSWNIHRGKPGPHKRLNRQGIVADQADPVEPGESVDPSEPKRKLRYDPNDFKYVSDMKWALVRNGWGPAERDSSNGETGRDDGGSLKLDGRQYSKGVGVHSDSEIVLHLDKKYSRFFADIGVNDRVRDEGSVKFQVFADGKKVYDSGVMNGSSPVKGVIVRTNDVKELRLVVTDAGDGATSDHADWAAARLLPVGATPISEAEYDALTGKSKSGRK
jgi:hypothetical protein